MRATADGIRVTFDPFAPKWRMLLQPRSLLTEACIELPRSGAGKLGFSDGIGMYKSEVVSA